MSNAEQPRRAITTPKAIAFSALVLIVATLGVNTAIERLETAGKIDTSSPGDRVQFVEERLFADDGDGRLQTTAYAEESLIRQSFHQDKGGGFRIFALGGSFMMGSPYLLQGYPNVAGGMPFFVGETVTRSNPGRTIEVVNVAAGAQNSARVRSIADQVLTLDPDALWVATCNNEGEPPPNSMRVWLNQQGGYRLLKRALTVQRPGSWYTPQDGDTESLREGFRSNIRWVLRAAQKRSVPVFLATLPVNLRYRGWDTGGHLIGDEVATPALPTVTPPPALPIPPGFEEESRCVTGSLLFEAEEFALARPLLRECLRTDETHERLAHVLPAYSAIADLEVGATDASTEPLLRASLGDCLSDGILLHYQHRWDEAIAVFEGCDDPAEALRWIGFSQLRRGDVDDARATLEQVVELAPRNRCRPSFNAILREEAANAPNAVLVDLEKHAREISPDGIPGPELFVDYCHMNWRGYAAMAEPLLEALEKHEPTLTITRQDPAEIAADAGLPPGSNAEQIRVTNEWTRGDPMPRSRLH